LAAQEIDLMQLREAATHLPGSLTVLNIALQPGFEDPKTLAMLRSVRGARIVSVFCTNGESGESDAENLYPSFLAAALREEAHLAFSVLEGEVRFLNFEDPGGYTSEEELRERWSKDSLAASLVKLILEIKPDIVLVAGDPRVKGTSAYRDTLVSALLQAVEVAAGWKRGGLPPGIFREPWRVARIFAEVKRGGIVLDYSGIKGPLAALARARAGQASASYSSLAHQLTLWRGSRAPRYELLKGTLPKSSKMRQLDQGLDARPGKPLDGISAALTRLSSQLVLASENQGKLRSSKTVLLRSVVSLMDSVDARLAEPVRPSARQWKFLLSWKRALEQLRNILLGLRIHFTIDEKTLSPRQLVYLTIDSVTGPPLKGTAEILFPAAEEGWIIDEAREKRLALRTGVPYKLISPEPLEFHLPAALFGLQRTSPRYYFSFFLLHRGPTRESSFVHRTNIPMLFAPRHTLEILTPIVKANEGEEVIVQFTNNTRDGVADRIRISSELVEAEGKPFRASWKGSSFIDTLRLHWKKTLADTSIVVPVSIGTIPVMNFAVRNFQVETADSDSVGIVTAFPSGTTVRGLHDLGVHAAVVSPGGALTQEMFRTLVLDERCLSLLSVGREMRSEIRSLAEQGGHVVILRQEEDDWNLTPIMPGVKLERTLDLGADAMVAFNDSSSLFRKPNAVDSSLWDSWLFFRAYHRIVVPSDGSVEVVVRDAASGTPLVVTERTGKGRITYVGLNLSHQMMNLHSEVMRFLANIISNAE
jgi:hypothetical protein